MARRHTQLGKFSPDFEQWLKTADIAAMDAIDSMPPAQARSLMTQIELSVPWLYDGLTYQDHTIVAPEVTARVFSAAETGSTIGEQRAFAKSLKPMVLIYHGGGWMYGGHTTESRLLRTFVRTLGFVAVSIDYRLAPEHPFPVPFDDCIAGLRWAVNNAASFRADAENVFIAGSSAGGNLTAAVTQWARDQGWTCIKGQVLQIPATCHYRHFHKDRWELESYDELKDVPILGAKKMSRFWDSYYPSDKPDTRVSPLLATSLDGLAPAYVQVAGSDILRDEGIAYAEALQDANVPMKLDIYPGVPHGVTADLFPLKAGAQIEEDLIENVKWLQSLQRKSGASSFL